MNRLSTIRTVGLIALAALVGAVRAEVTSGPPAASAAEPSNRFAEEPQRLPPTEVRAYREDRAACDRAQGTGQDACRAQLAAKYAEMDKLCRGLSAAEFPTCIKSAYSAD